MNSALLEVEGITKRFGAVTACEDVSLDLRVGEIHAVIGPNGAGKSTLISQICGTVRPDAGRVYFLGEDVTDLGIQERAKRGLARTFQISALAMDDTVLQNALLGALGARGRAFRFFKSVLRNKELRQRAEYALERVGLDDVSNVRVAELSHGQRRKLEVAVALTLQPHSYLMDEPMAGMGAEGTQQLTELLREIKIEAPILLVEHDMDAVFELADRLSVLDYGKIIATGTVDEVRADPKVRSAYLGEQA